jgi:hypothetical protein
VQSNSIIDDKEILEMAKLPIKTVIVKNNTRGQIRWEQMVFLGNPEYVCDLAPSISRRLPGLRAARDLPLKTRRLAARRSIRLSQRQAWW